MLFFRTDRFGGELKSSDEGRVFWVERDELTQYKLSHDFIDMVHVYPTMAEALKIAALSFFKDVSKLSCCAE